MSYKLSFSFVFPAVPSVNLYTCFIQNSYCVLIADGLLPIDADNYFG